jgi:ribose 5-phosphate isomerase B
VKVAVGADHKGFEFKEKIKQLLKTLGHEVLDFGTDSSESVDYPDYGLKVARAVADGSVDRGITVCWTGNGMNMAANKVKGVRAGMGLSVDMARLTRLHNDANVMSLASKYVPAGELESIVKTFLETEFEGGRHIARVKRITDEETSLC